jgi:biopolymer transport protein ExbD
MPERYVDYNKGRVPVNLPHDAKNADIDSNVDRSNAVIVTVSSDGKAYLGTDRSPLKRDELRDKVRELAAKQSEEDRMVYLSVDVAADYGAVVEVCDAIRTAEVSRVGVLAFNPRHDWPARITIELPPQPNPNEDLNQLKPNPLTLVVTISADLKVKLNQDVFGSVNELEPLSEKLAEIFRQRRDNFAYRPGFETATNVPEDERIEKTVTIKAERRIKYGDVVRVIDALRGAGARPILLRLDDLSD